MELDEIIIKVLKNIEYIKQLEINLNVLESNGDIKSIINNKKKSKFINGFLNPYINTVRYKMTYNTLTEFIESGLNYNQFDGYDIMEAHLKNKNFKKTTNDFFIKRILDYDQLLLIYNMANGYIKELKTNIEIILQAQTKIYNY